MSMGNQFRRERTPTSRSHGTDLAKPLTVDKNTETITFGRMDQVEAEGIVPQRLAVRIRPTPQVEGLAHFLDGPGFEEYSPRIPRHRKITSATSLAM